MKFHVVALAAIALTSSVSTAPVAYAHDGPGRDNTGVIVTQSGPVRGALHATSAAFLGIPYARPPVGGRRWWPPQPLGHWSGAVSQRLATLVPTYAYEFDDASASTLGAMHSAELKY